jgi:hypothetical protein
MEIAPEQLDQLASKVSNTVHEQLHSARVAQHEAIRRHPTTADTRRIAPLLPVRKNRESRPWVTSLDTMESRGSRRTERTGGRRSDGQSSARTAYMVMSMYGYAGCMHTEVLRLTYTQRLRSTCNTLLSI